MKSRAEYFKEFLNFLWLRPENALLQTMLAEKCASMYAEQLERKKLKAIDVSCGDGIFSFIAFGGELDATSDMFRSINMSQYRTGNFDTFDHFDESYQVSVTKEPEFKYHTGTDWKNNLLKKAAMLNYYGTLILHDNNMALPLNSAEYDFTFSNCAYMVRNFEAHLRDLLRITKVGGLIVLEVKMRDEFARHTAAHYAPKVMGDRFNSIIDAGRLESWRGLRPRKEMEKILGGLDGSIVIDMQPVYGGIIAKIWDVGLRPLFNPLARMANSLTPESRLSIKKEWCGIVRELAGGLLENYVVEEKDAIEWIITLQRS